MKAVFGRIGSLMSKVPVVAVVMAAFVLGYLAKGVVSTPGPASTGQPTEAAEPAEEIWTCSMHPEVRFSYSRDCPKCGMPLALVESEPKKPKAAQQKKYACAMFCVPPMSNPGKCPVCGMDMVEVEVAEGGPGGDAGHRTLTLSPAAQKLAEVQVAPVERKFVEAEIRMVGKIDYDETRLKYITAWVPGRLDRLYVDYTGVPVSIGDHLVYMYSPELRIAQVELLEAIKTAGGFNAGVDDWVRESAQGLIEDGRTKLRLWGLTEEQIKEIEDRGKPSDHMTIYAPIGGIVIHKNATEGMYVDTGTRIYTIADLSRVWVKLDAYESDLAWLRYGQTVEFETEAYPGEKFHGTVAFIDPVLDSRTRTVKVRVNVENPDGRLKPQMFVRAVVRAKLAEGGLIVNAELAGKWISPMHPEVIKDQPGPCDVCGMPLVRAETLGFVSADDVDARPPLVIPASAPLITGKRAVVYVELPNQPGTYQGRVITLGARAGEYYLVREGLADGERVVVNGNFKIDSAIQIQAQPSMMSPESGADQAPSHAEHRAGVPISDDAAKPEDDRLAVPEAFRAQLSKVFDAYFRIHAGLSGDALDDARAASKQAATALADVDMSLLEGPAHNAWMKELTGISRSVAGITAAGDIKQARFSFALLSESMIAVARRFGPGPKPVYRLQCPMAFDNRGADWLQDQRQTANPYFGSAMFRCGVLKETIGSAPVEESAGDDGGK